MKWGTYKDLKIGDMVAYENVYVHSKLTISGQGKIIGFGFAERDNATVWVEREGEIQGINYRNVRKV